VGVHALRRIAAAAVLGAAAIGAPSMADAQVVRPLPPRPYPPTIWVPGTVDTVPTEYWGAIAYERATGAQGYAYDFATERDASVAALESCGQQACLTMITFKSGCGILLDGPQGPVTARGATAQEAEVRARQQCTDPQCHVVAWACTR
jgi:hypothetical protein